MPGQTAAPAADLIPLLAETRERTLALDHIYLGSQSYASTTSALASTYANIRLILFGYMQSIRIGQASEAGR